MSRYSLILSCILVLLVACTPTAVEPSISMPAEDEIMSEVDQLIQWGEIQKEGDYQLGEPVEEVVTVYNCDNPMDRSDTLTEVRKIKRDVNWNVVGEVGGSVEASIIAAGAEIESKIASGYELEVGEEMSRGRELHLPVGAFRSADYIIVYQPAVWQGFLPFTFQSGEARIDYLYQQVAFGDVRGYVDQTERDCRRVAIPTPPPLPPPIELESGTVVAVEPSSQPTEAPAPVVEPLWIETDPSAADSTSQIVRDLGAGEWMYVSSGSISMKGTFCGNEADQVCVLIYEATSPHTVVVDYVDQGHAYVARTRLMGYQELIDTHSPLYWTEANCDSDGCGKATILYFRDGVQVNNPVTLLRPGS